MVRMCCMMIMLENAERNPMTLFSWKPNLNRGQKGIPGTWKTANCCCAKPILGAASRCSTLLRPVWCVRADDSRSFPKWHPQTFPNHMFGLMNYHFKLFLPAVISLYPYEWGRLRFRVGSRFEHWSGHLSRTWFQNPIRDRYTPWKTGKTDLIWSLSLEYMIYVMYMYIYIYTHT